MCAARRRCKLVKGPLFNPQKRNRDGSREVVLADTGSQLRHEHFTEQPNSSQELSSRRMFARRPSRLAQWFRTASRRLQVTLHSRASGAPLVSSP